MNSRTSTLFCAIVALVAHSTVVAQWSSNSAANLSVADRSGEQTQSKIRATSDGGCYISWFDNATGGYDVYIQRLDANGVEQFAHNGVLVADRSFSSTQDYDFAVDADDNAVICYRDDRAGGTQIGVNKILPNGTLAWGANGVIVSNTTAFIGNTKIAVTSDGHYVVGWTENATLVLQRLDADGAPQWLPSGITTTPTVGSYSLGAIQPSLTGSVIAFWVHATGGFSSPRFLNSQRFDASGNPLWNEGNPLIVFDGTSVQIGYFPSFITDDAGGAIYAWYENGGDRNAYFQHVSAAGAEMYPHNGVAGSLQAGRIALNPDVAYDAANDDVFLFWPETNSNQSLTGLYGQRFRAGVRQWGDNGLEIRPLDGGQESFANAVYADGVAMAFAFDQSGGAQVVGYGFDVDGNAIWSGGSTVVCSNLTGKSRLDAVASACGQALLTWGDGDDVGMRDILAQNVLSDGTLGAPTFPLGDMNCDQALTIEDVPLLALALVNGDAYAAQQGCCNPLNADYTMDGELAGDDIAGFVADITD